MQSKLLTALVFTSVILTALGCPYWVELLLAL